MYKSSVTYYIFPQLQSRRRICQNQLKCFISFWNVIIKNHDVNVFIPFSISKVKDLVQEVEVGSIMFQYTGLF